MSEQDLMYGSVDESTSSSALSLSWHVGEAFVHSFMSEQVPLLIVIVPWGHCVGTVQQAAASFEAHRYNFGWQIVWIIRLALTTSRTG